MTNSFDVFLCHNSGDKDEIRKIADKLINFGLNPWFDEREIPPGSVWQIELEKQISIIKSVAVFVGHNGIGPWQNEELRAFIDEFIKTECPIIPVILPTAKEFPKLPKFLNNRQYVDLRVPYPDPWFQMRWGITGKKPLSPTDCDYELNQNNNEILLLNKTNQIIELKCSKKLSEFSDKSRKEIFDALDKLSQSGIEIALSDQQSDDERILLELAPGKADKIYKVVADHELDSIGIINARLYPSLKNPPKKKHRIQLNILLDRVKKFWIDGVLDHSLHHNVIIELGKQSTHDFVEPLRNNTISFPAQRQNLELDNNNIEAIFDVTGLLLILGDPGSGKTITLLELATILIKRAESDVKERVPIILSLSNWEKSLTIKEWIVKELTSNYQVPEKLGRSWLNKGYFIPLLDGLDELRIEDQPECVSAINKFIDEINPPGLVICCRLNDYRWLPEYLKFNGAIILEPLKQNQIDNYFRAFGKKLEPLQIAIKEDSSLADLSTSPLLLNVMSLAYQSDKPTNISGKEQALDDRRRIIFDTYIDRMLQQKTSKCEIYSKNMITAWLGWLANKTIEQPQSVFYIENMQPSWLENAKQKITYRLISSALHGLSIGLFYAALFFISYLSLYFLYPIKNSQVLESIVFYSYFTELPIVELILESIGIGIVYALPSFVIILILSDLDSSSQIGVYSGIGFYFFLLLSTIAQSEIINLSVFLTPLTESIILGLAVGVGIRSLNRIDIVEKLAWSWSSFCDGIMSGFYYSYNFFWKNKWIIVLLITILSAIRSSYFIDGIIFGVLNAFLLIFILMFFLGLIGGIYVAFAGGYINILQNVSISPNYGIKQSIRNGIKVTIVSTLIPIFLLSLFFLISPYISLENIELEDIQVLLSGGLLGLVAGLNRGISAAIKHYSLRITLMLFKKIPMKLVHFLDYSEKLIFINKVGGGYKFLHRSLQEHLAKFFRNSE